MKNLSILALTLLLITSCEKKDNYEIEGDLPNRTMKGTVDGRYWEVSSLNGSLIGYIDGSGYEVNLNGWQQETDESIYLRIYPFSFQPQEYKLSEVDYPYKKQVWIGYTTDKNEKTVYAKDGLIIIDSYEDSVIRGSYDFHTTDDKHIRGWFALKPMYVTE